MNSTGACYLACGIGSPCRERSPFPPEQKPRYGVSDGWWHDRKGVARSSGSGGLERDVCIF